ncbi:CHAT domain-containing protein [Streptacidiphilus anmyonensis]|uniref:CHAT domain-containing protein n=1 Tax=Streptacidiphilus anmyonensis TaxID=405782 RepID=UPI0005A6958C|nr:CHAT domain-containing protein [Streptacidiphilus anmyonensis]
MSAAAEAGEEEFLARLRRIGEDPSGEGAADPATARAAGRFLRREYREHGGVRPAAAYPLGLYYLRHSVARGVWPRRPAREIAVGLLTPIFFADAEPVPADLLPVVLAEARKRAARALRAALGTGDPDQLDGVAAQWRRIAAVTPYDAAEAVDVAEGLGVALANLFDHTGERAELDDVVAFCRPVLEHLPAGASPGPVRVILATTIAVRCERFGSFDLVGDLDQSIALMRAELAIREGRDRPPLLSSLAAVYLSRAESAQDPADVDEAVALARQAVELAGPRHPLRSSLEASMTAALLARYHLCGDPADLAEALTFSAGADTPVGTGSVSSVSGGRIAAALALGQSALADSASPDLDRAVELLRTAASDLPDASPVKPQLLQTLSAVLRHRHIVGSSAADLDAAVDVARLAVTVEQNADPRNRAKALSWLSWLLGARYEEAGDPRDADAAVAAGREAVTHVPVEELPAASAYYWGLVLALRCQHPGQAAETQEALQVLRRLATSPGTPPRFRSGATIGLAQTLRQRADRTEADLDEAVELLRRVRAEWDAETYHRALVEHKLAGALAERFAERGSRQDAAEGLALLTRSLHLTQVPVGLRLEAAVTAAALEEKVGAPGWTARAADRLAAAVDLLPLTAARTLHRADRQRLLGESSGLAARAAAFALADERPGESPGQRAARALGLLEAGRTVLLNQAYDTRGDLDGVRRAAPGLARRFLELREQLDRSDLETLGDAAAAPSSGAVVGTADAGRAGTGTAGVATAAQVLSLEEAAGDRRRAALAFAEVVEQIRALPGQSGFMRAPDAAELTAQAALGPIAVVNVAELRSDAFLVTSAGIRALRLPALTVDAATEAAERLHRAQETSDSDEMFRVLGWLWDAVAGPVLDELGLDRAPGPDGLWPRVWWVASGVLANMPLHAAGRYAAGSAANPGGDGDRPPESVLDRVVSSYAPNVRTLRYLRERSARSAARSRPDRGNLVVAMGSTPGSRLRDLPNAEAEADFVAGLLPRAVLLTHGTGAGGTRPDGTRTAAPTTAAPSTAAPTTEAPTSERVLAELGRSRIAHFACHAEADTADPSRSGLLLLDGPLTVSALGAEDLESVEFAFLSACGTALNRARDLLDESIQLVSALQLAGIPQVVGTLWEVEDFPSLAVVQSFYTRLGAEFDPSAVALTLHGITRLVRDEWPDAPGIWAAHMHAGC